MTDFYPIIQIADDTPAQIEQQGTKPKDWLHLDKGKYLFKIGREKTGENWAEIVACELCALLGLPHAHYEFAVQMGKKGVLSKTFVPSHGRLVVGNELLAEIHSTDPARQSPKLQNHTFNRIFNYLNNPEILLPMDWQPPRDAIDRAVDVFLGYLLLDAWIANQDRHDENWGVIHHDKIYLAPTYDHAASMGQEARHYFSRKLKWGPSDFSSEKLRGDYCLRRPAFVLLRPQCTTPLRYAVHYGPAQMT